MFEFKLMLNPVFECPVIEFIFSFVNIELYYNHDYYINTYIIILIHLIIAKIIVISLNI